MNTINSSHENTPTDLAIETKEWLESLDYVYQNSGSERVIKLLKELQIHAHSKGVQQQLNIDSPYINTIHHSKQPPYPGDRDIERVIRSYVRWNAMAMVVKANKDSNLGGHISTYASSATLLEIGFNHFFRNASANYGGDLVYFQGHASPGIYARAYLEGRIDEQHLLHFRQELQPGGGLSSYPHPRLMPNFWQFPTVSMGLGPIMGIYQARFMKYLENRGLKPKNGGKVWVFVGDGETDEPETLGAINLAAREKLDNLVFIINCNLQRLDGPVRGNGKIIQELARLFHGSGWNVLKVIWGSLWDSLLEQDPHNILLRRMEEAVDGDFQKYSVEGGDYIRDHFFGRSEELLNMVKHLSDYQLKKLDRGGHDPEKVFAAYEKAASHTGSPSVILAKTVKGYGMGESGEGKNISHQQKKLNEEELRHFRTRFSIPISDEEINNIPFCRFQENSREMIYLQKHREKLGGYLPERNTKFPPITINSELFDEFMKGTEGRELSTTMVFVRILSKLLKDTNIGKLIVPIVPDEARTFGMEALFRQTGIYASTGQLYEPVDRDSLLYYKESINGQILEEGINEAGSMSSFIAAGTAYSNFGIPMIPFFIYYSMFGFQRIGDLAWVAGDIMAKGFMLGATAGRTTLNGEGLQHQDGHSHVLASTNPACVCYDPAYSYELAVIIKDGLKRMYVNDEKVFYYLTLENENYAMPPMPKGSEEGILKGVYKLSPSKASGEKAHIMASASILTAAFKTRELLEEEYGISIDIWSVTSFVELRRDGIETDRLNLLNSDKPSKVPYITQAFSKEQGVVVGVSDYMRTLSDGISRWMPLPYTVLGTDGFGLSEKRELLRDHFEIDEKFIGLAILSSLQEQNKIDKTVIKSFLKKMKISKNKPSPF